MCDEFTEALVIMQIQRLLMSYMELHENRLQITMPSFIIFLLSFIYAGFTISTYTLRTHPAPANHTIYSIPFQLNINLLSSIVSIC